jgi:hypothetical protein
MSRFLQLLSLLSSVLYTMEAPRRASAHMAVGQGNGQYVLVLGFDGRYSIFDSLWLTPLS